MKSKYLPTAKELFYNKIADRWETKINNKETEKRIRVIFNELLTGIDLKNKKVIEVGCGLGIYSLKMSQKGAVVTGIDVGERLIKISRKKVRNGKFVVGSALDIPFRKDKYDITLCTEVIEHTENPERAISELFRVTKPGGYIILTTPNKVFKPVIDLLRILRIRFYQGNENWLGINELKKCIARNNGKIILEKYFNFFYPIPILDKFEKYTFLQNLMINQGYKIKK
jgi:2-polyprenyl-3-methyl-5-hydroxy-6-metoxy-1,4-benzoquinol methylase